MSRTIPRGDNLTISQVAEMLGTSTEYVYKQIRRGYLKPYIPPGNKRGKQIEPAELERWQHMPCQQE